MTFKSFMGIVIFMVCVSCWEFKARSSDKFANISLDHRNFDFGNVKEGEMIEHVFGFVNDTDIPLLITNVASSCGCAAVKWPEKVMPHRRDSIIVQFDSNFKLGRQVKTVIIQGNIPRNIELKMEGFVRN